MDSSPTAPRPRLWNPDAAAAWSLLFSPVFGAWLHALNWRALGDRERERQSMAWVVGGIGVLVVSLILSSSPVGFVGHVLDHGIAILFLLAWYVFAARPQARLVNERYSAAFEHRPWRRPLLMALAGFASYVVVFIAICAVDGMRNL